LSHRGEGGATAETLSKELAAVEREAGRESVTMGATLDLLEELTKEGFCHRQGDIWRS
jgi:A/G-specific adenine glycosylase